MIDYHIRAGELWFSCLKKLFIIIANDAVKFEEVY